MQFFSIHRKSRGLHRIGLSTNVGSSYRKIPVGPCVLHNLHKPLRRHWIWRHGFGGTDYTDTDYTDVCAWQIFTSSIPITRNK